MAEPDIFVFVPVYRGAEVLPETLRAIRAQTYEGFRVLVSIDDADPAAIDVYRAVAGGDPRFTLVVQPERLGWPGHFDWLIRRADLPFVIYWQQDDLASTDYLAALRSTMLADEGAAVAYADVQWFGARTARHVVESIDGPPLARVLQQFETLSYIPLRGLMRTSMLPPGPTIRPSRDDASQGEFSWMPAIAARGRFVRVPGPLYFKRAHPAATHEGLLRLPDHRRRRETALLGARVLAHAREAASGTVPDGTLLAVILDRLAVHRPGRAFFFEPEPTVPAARELLLQLADEGGLDLGDTRWHAGAETGLERPIHPRVRAALAAERERVAALGVPEPPLPARLGWGWHAAEPWGAWTSGEHASVELGAWPGGRVRIEGTAFGADARARIGWSLDGGEPEFLSFGAGEPVALQVDAPAGARRVHVHTPDAVAPVEAGVSADPRRLGFGIERVIAD